MVPVKLVTFDVTGTILFFRTPIVEKYVATGLKYGIKADPAVLKNNFQETWDLFNVKHPNFGKNTGLGWQNWWTRFVERTFADFTQPGDEIKITKIADELLNFYETGDAFTIRPGTINLLGHLQNKGIKLGVISNYDVRLKKILKCLNLDKYFNFILVSYEVGYAKPDKEIFEKALSLGNCLSGKEVIHVGNSVKLDYHAAKAAGFNAILITENVIDFKTYGIHKNEVFHDFFALEKHFN